MSLDIDEIGIEDLEQECGCEITEQHECDANHLPQQLRILKLLPDDPKQVAWEFFSIWLANAEDVELGEAEVVGELMNLSSVKVNFCPFCGVKLSTAD